MKVGILEAGGPPADLADQYDSYGDMVLAMLGPGFTGHAYDVCAGELPDDPTACEAWIITGSPAGVYEPDPWIAGLSDFVQRASGHAPMLGICFGHQLMAQAFGGRVVKSPKGWGVGLHDYDLTHPAPWMDGGGQAPRRVRLAVSHQDQVVSIGPGCEVIGGNAFTPYGVLAYPARRAVSIQAHPEFAADYARALIVGRRGAALDLAVADSAIRSLDQPDDRSRVGAWLGRFLTSA